MKIRTKLSRLTEMGWGLAKLTQAAGTSFYNPHAREAYLRAIREVGVYQRTPRLRVVDADQLIDPLVSVRMSCLVSGQWQVSCSELGVINQLALKHRPQHIFEIGTFDGRTALNLHLNCPDARLTTVDLPPEQQNLPDNKIAGTLIADHVAQEKIRQIYGNSLTYDFSDYYGGCDFIFIDAGHSYYNAAADTRTALRLAEGREAVIIWHDYAEWPGVTRAVEEVPTLLVNPPEVVRIRGTSLAVLVCPPGRPLEIKREHPTP